MTALSAQRANPPFIAASIRLFGKAEQVYKGGRAYFDTSTGLVAKGFLSANLTPIGKYVDTQLTPSGGYVDIELDYEMRAFWQFNSDSTDQVTQQQVGSLCYCVDDQTVAKTSAGGTRSVAGRVWKVDDLRGVLVEIYH